MRLVSWFPFDFLPWLLSRIWNRFSSTVRTSSNVACELMPFKSSFFHSRLSILGFHPPLCAVGSNNKNIMKWILSKLQSGASGYVILITCLISKYSKHILSVLSIVIFLKDKHFPELLLSVLVNLKTFSTHF